MGTLHPPPARGSRPVRGLARALGRAGRAARVRPRTANPYALRCLTPLSPPRHARRPGRAA